MADADDTPPPAGGSYLRDAKTGALKPVVVPQEAPPFVAEPIVVTGSPKATQSDTPLETSPPDAAAKEKI